jgi:glycosyltransferase involved in cell wall biosynthesis
MRIAIDARELTGQATGVGRYLWQLLRAWNDMPAAAAHEFLLCNRVAHRLHLLPNLRIRHLDEPRFHGTLWEQLSLPFLLGDADVLFAPAYTGPLLSRVPMVVTIHDVSFAAHPEWFSWKEGLRRRWLTGASARRAARVLTVSDFSKQEIVRYLHVDPGKVDVIYSGIHQVAPAPTGATVSIVVVAPPPQILYVGSIFNRRHVPDLIQAFSLVAREHPGVRLAIVGDNRTMPRVDIEALAAASGVADRIQRREYIPDAELAALYSEASALAFLSDYEGFGFTPLEGLSAGIPPVVLDTPVAREIYGPAAAYVAQPQPEAIAAALKAVLFDTAQRARILDAAPAQLQRYSWSECAHRTLQVLLTCAS